MVVASDGETVSFIQKEEEDMGLYLRQSKKEGLKRRKAGTRLQGDHAPVSVSFAHNLHNG